mgnify:CR=1 FL=1
MHVYLRVVYVQTKRGQLLEKVCFTNADFLQLKIQEQERSNLNEKNLKTKMLYPKFQES